MSVDQVNDIFLLDLQFSLDIVVVVVVVLKFKFQSKLSFDTFLLFQIQAEKFLESVEGNQNYAILLLNLVGKEDIDGTIRVAGAIAFKNFVKRNWNAHAVNFTIFVNLH